MTEWKFLCLENNAKFYFFKFTLTSPTSYTFLVTDTVHLWQESIEEVKALEEKCSQLSTDFFKLNSTQLLVMLQSTFLKDGPSQPLKGGLDKQDENMIQVTVRIPLSFIQFSMLFCCSKIIDASRGEDLVKFNQFWIWLALGENTAQTRPNVATEEIFKHWNAFSEYYKGTGTTAAPASHLLLNDATRADATPTPLICDAFGILSPPVGRSLSENITKKSGLSDSMPESLKLSQTNTGEFSTGNDAPQLQDRELQRRKELQEKLDTIVPKERSKKRKIL